MKQADLQRLYDENEAENERLTGEHASAIAAGLRPGAQPPPPPERQLVAVRFGKIRGRVATYSGETPRRYLVRLEEKVVDPDNPDYGPAWSRWIPAAELEVGD